MMIAICAALSAPGVASAAPKTVKPTAATVQALAACMADTDDAARLACYDKAARSLVEAEKTGDVVVVDQAQVKEVKRQSFGFNINLGPLFDHPGKHEQVDELTSTIASAHLSADGKWIISTAEGQVWRQIDTEVLPETPKAGDKVVMRRGMLGSFFLTVGNQGAIRAHRDN
jgi:hypothetical protein